MNNKAKEQLRIDTKEFRGKLIKDYLDSPNISKINEYFIIKWVEHYGEETE